METVPRTPIDLKIIRDICHIAVQLKSVGDSGPVGFEYTTASGHAARATWAREDCGPFELICRPGVYRGYAGCGKCVDDTRPAAGQPLIRNKKLSCIP